VSVSVDNDHKTSPVPPDHRILDLFHPAVSDWFREVIGTPTPAQVKGWPAIVAGQNTLLLAPTGSGKTLAAFLACLDQLWKEPTLSAGVQLLYVSPLKALNNDIYRNLHVPLLGVQEIALRRGERLPRINVGLRTGDTTTQERTKQLRTPPHVLITTPESLHLLLTSNGREMLRSVRWCIVDEIHVLCPNKRGVFLAILLERLQHLTGEPGFVRIGLSATQRPMEEVARYLGGLRYASEGNLEHRSVTIIDAGQRKNLDVQVVSPVERFGPLPEKSVWPSIYRYLYDQIQQHRSTIVFGNNRRSVERITTALNELHDEAIAAFAPSLPTDHKIKEERDTAEQELNPPILSLAPLARAHHSSISLDVRRQTEEMLKEGRIKAVVATASLELGIDMGAVDLVCQVESSGSIARALQRVGRAGHLVGGQSKGRLVPKTLPDLLEQAALAREMLHGQVEALHVPTGCLDLVAQQVVAMVAVENWNAPHLYALLRQAYPCRDLTPEAFENVLDMVSGRFPAEAFRELRPRVVWDRIHNRLHALPGSKHLALLNGGSIPDTGQYTAYIQGTTNRIGELDEEFIYERRVGDVFTLGTTSWRIESIEADRVYVSRSEGMPAMMPFWRGEKVARSSDLGNAVGRLIDDTLHLLAQNQEETQDWLQEQCQLDSYAARNLAFFLRRQIETAGAVPSHRTILCEAFRDQVGDWHLAILSSLGARFHLTLRFALESLWRERYGYQPYCLHHDDGVLMRLVDIGDPPLDLLRQLDPATVEQRVLNELADSALFAIRFRHNAARALMLPISSPDKRAPLWLQRLKARNLLQVARQHSRFPVVIETCRECLHDHLDVDRLREVLEGIKTDRIQLVTRRAETPSPFAGQLLFGFTAAFMYDYDKVELRGTTKSVQVDKGLLDQMLSPETFDHLLDPRAVEQVERRLQGVGLAPRTSEELFEWIRRLGDVRDDEIPEAARQFTPALKQQGRVIDWSVPNRKETRLILAEEKEVYEAAWPSSNGSLNHTNESASKILRRFLLTHALVGLEDVLRRYPFERSWVEEQLHHWSKQGLAVELQSWGDEPTVVFAAPENLDQVRRGSLALRRREVPTVSPTVFAHFVQRWQSGQSESNLAGPEGVRNTLERLQGLSLPRELWEQTVLPSRVANYQARWLDDITASGEWCWVCRSPTDDHKSVSFIRRDHLQFYPYPDPDRPLEGDAATVHDLLRNRGAMFLVDLAQATSLPPNRVKAALWELVDRGLLTNDRFDVLRRSDSADSEPSTDNQRANLRAMRRHRVGRPEGRWSLIPWGQPEPEARALFEVQNLLERYGVVSRDLSLLDPTLLPWRVHYEVLSRLELSGEVHRGYFVEGLAGAQFALPDAVRRLGELRTLSTETQPLVLLNALDPANLYGPSAPLGWPLVNRNAPQLQIPESENGVLESEEGGENEATWQRRAGNWLVTKAGRIVLAVEASGKRLFSAAWASDEELFAALQVLRDLLKTAHGLDLRGKISVEEWNGEPVLQSPAQKALEMAGFVRDYQSMTLYAVWS
jgi:ATP-dependent Lhr-like helicase